ncbi:MAG TPA: hypothetical protein VMX17_01765 [Candidatus Glassbacteria bacterium]|nr:hypothetical protein [Candidatus Glassbacteria bacterium]
MTEENQQSKFYQILFNYLGVQPKCSPEMTKQVKKAERKLEIVYPEALRELFILSDNNEPREDNLNFLYSYTEPKDGWFHPSSILRRFEMIFPDNYFRIENQKLYGKKLKFCEDVLLSRDLAILINGSNDPPVYCQWYDEECPEQNELYNFKLFHSLTDWVYMQFFEFARPDYLMSKKHYKGFTPENIENLAKKFSKTVIFDTMNLDRYMPIGGYEEGALHKYLFIANDKYLILTSRMAIEVFNPTFLNCEWEVGALNEKAFAELLEMIFEEFPYMRNQFRFMRETQNEFTLNPLELAITGIDSPEWEIRWGVIEGLRIFKGPVEEKLKYLLKLLDDDERRVRFDTLELVKELITGKGGEFEREIKRKFFQLLTDPEKKIRDKVLNSSAYFLDEDIPQFLLMLKTDNKEFKLDLLKSLTYLHKKPEAIKKDILATIYSYLDDGDSDIQEQAITSLWIYRTELPKYILDKLEGIYNRKESKLGNLIEQMLKEGKKV